LKKFSTVTEAIQLDSGTGVTARRWCYEQAFAIQHAIAKHVHTLRAGGNEDELPRVSQLILQIVDRTDEQRWGGQ
jgi:hypothetical protein